MGLGPGDGDNGLIGGDGEGGEVEASLCRSIRCRSLLENTSTYNGFKLIFHTLIRQCFL